MQELFSALSLWLSAHPLITGWYTAIARLLFPVLSALILVRAIRSLLRIPHTPEVWAQLSLPSGGSIPLTHWENILGRGKSADAILNYPSISRQHAALCRGEDGAWTVYDLGSKGGTAVNGTPVTEQAPLKLGDTLTLGGVPLVFLPQTVGEREELEKKRQAERPAAMWPSFLWLTVFQILTAIQLTLAAGEKASPVIPICFLILTAVMWLYAAALRLGRCVGFELETIAFYLSTLSLAVTASSTPGSLPKQLLAIVLGMGLFLALGLFLRDLERVKKRRWLMAAGAIGLLGITLVLGKAKFGATNWVTLGSISFQPSEIAKICYIFAGSATLERLFRRRNLALFIVLTGVCIGLRGLPGADERLRHGGHLLCDLSGHCLSPLRGRRNSGPHLRRRGLWRGDHRTVQALYSEPLRRVGPRLGGGLRLRLSADPHHVGGGLRRTVRHGCRKRLAGAYPCRGHGSGVWHVMRGMGAGYRAAGGGLHPDLGMVRRSRLPDWPIQLLYHRRLRGRLSAGVSDQPECVRLRGSSAPHRRDLPLRVKRRLRHAVGMGAAGVSEDHGHPCGRQLCHRPGGGAEAGRGSRPYGGTGRGCL